MASGGTLDLLCTVVLAVSILLLAQFYWQSARHNETLAFWIPVRRFSDKNVTDYYRLTPADVGIHDIDALLASERYAKASELHDAPPSRFAPLKEVESKSFRHAAVICPNLRRITGDRVTYDICVPRDIERYVDDDRTAYSIAPRRDRNFEIGFLEETLYAYPLKVFVTDPSAELRPFPLREPLFYMDGNYMEGTYVEDNAIIAERANISILPAPGWTAIKDLFDARSDTHRVEYAFIDLGELTFDAMSAISWVIPACNFVATVPAHEFERIRYMVLRLAHDTFYHYATTLTLSSAENHSDGTTSVPRAHLSFMCRCCLEKYGVAKPSSAVFQMQELVK